MESVSYSTNPFSRNNPGTMGSRIAGINSMFATGTGAQLRMGTMESFGWNYSKGVSEGFLGLKTTRVGSAMNNARLNNQNMYRAGMKSMARQARQLGVRGSAVASAKFAGKTGMKSLGLLGTAYMAYEGYQSGGVMGAAAGVGESIAWSAGIRMAGAALGGAAAITAGGLGAVALGTYAIGEAGRAHRKGLRNIEFGGGDQILQAMSSAGAATSRQRAAMALQNTHINGRMAMGNEALLMHTQF